MSIPFDRLDDTSPRRHFYNVLIRWINGAVIRRHYAPRWVVEFRVGRPGSAKQRGGNEVGEGRGFELGSKVESRRRLMARDRGNSTRRTIFVAGFPSWINNRVARTREGVIRTAFNRIFFYLCAPSFVVRDAFFFAYIIYFSFVISRIVVSNGFRKISISTIAWFEVELKRNKSYWN